MKLLTTLLIAVPSVFIANIGFADNNIPTSNQTNTFVYQPAPVVSPGKGWYVGGDLGGGNSKCSNCATTINSQSVITTTSTTDTGATATVFGGYQFNPYLALELGFGALPQVKITETGSASTYFPAYTFKATAANSHVYVAAKGMLPLSSQFGLFTKLGFDAEQVRYNYNDWYNNYDVTINTSGIYFALGANYNFTPH